MWLDKILQRGHRIRKAECGSELPDNPTMDDIRKEVYRIAQMAKEVQNNTKYWSEKDWREISKAIEAVEDKYKR